MSISTDEALPPCEECVWLLGPGAWGWCARIIENKIMNQEKAMIMSVARSLLGELL